MKNHKVSRPAGVSRPVQLGRPAERWGWLRKKVKKLTPGRKVEVDLEVAGATEAQLRNAVGGWTRDLSPRPPAGYAWGVKKGAEYGIFYVILAPVSRTRRKAARARAERKSA